MYGTVNLHRALADRPDLLQCKHVWSTGSLLQAMVMIIKPYFGTIGTEDCACAELNLNLLTRQLG